MKRLVQPFLWHHCFVSLQRGRWCSSSKSTDVSFMDSRNFASPQFEELPVSTFNAHVMGHKAAAGAVQRHDR